MRWLLLSALILQANAKDSSLVRGVSTAKLAEIRPVVEQMISDKKLAGGAVLVMRHGEVVYQEEFGHRDLENKLPVEKDTLYRIYSMTKGLTSTLALMLCEEGKMSLDDPIGLHLPELKEQSVFVSESETEAARRNTTVRDLLRHTSGYGNSWGGPLGKLYRESGVSNREAPLSNMVESLAPLPLLYQPGKRWVYGASSDVLAAVVASVEGQPFEKVMQDRLLTPLGMTDTFYQVPAEKAHRLAVHYRMRKGELTVADSAEKSTYLNDPAFKGGGSGLVSTISDYAIFLQMIANGGVLQEIRYLREDTVGQMRTNQLPREIECISFGEDKRHGTGFGLGFSVKYRADDRWDQHAPVGEYGWGGAASTHYWVSPKHNLIVVTMEQTMPYNWNLEQTLKPIIYGAIKN